MIRDHLQLRGFGRRVADVVAGVALGAAAALLAAYGLRTDPCRETGRATAPVAQGGAGRGGVFAARALSVIDGDTFEARVAAFPGQEIVTRIRVAGLDAPELRGRCQAESDGAREAAAALAHMVKDKPLTLTELRGDKYFGRVVARVAGPGAVDVGEAMVAAGFGRAYSGGKRAGWC